MTYRINFFAEPSEPNAAPRLIAHPTRDFADLEEARVHAFAAANNPTIMASSLTIDSDDGTTEQWVCDDGTWKLASA
jgi:hypothetical protein